MANNTSLYVVLDANILIRDFWMSGPDFSYLLTHQFLGHRPVIPEVAFLEARAHLERRAKELLSNRYSSGKGSNGNTLRLLRLFNYKRLPPKQSWNLERLLDRWERHIKKTLERFGGSVLESPRVEISDIVQRSIKRKKPFSNGDRGFRDTIIWLSTLSLIGPDSRVSFVTANTQDFFGENSAEPHPEILQEADTKLGDQWKMLFHRSLDDFIAEFDSDRSASSQALQRALISNSLSGFNLWNWLEENLVGAIDRDDFDGINWAGIPYHAEAPRLRDVEQLVSLDIPRVMHLAEDTYRLYCDLSLIGHFVCDVAYENAENIVNTNQILWKDDSDSFWTTIGVRAVATFLVRIDFDVRGSEVVSFFSRPLVHWDSYDQVIKDLEEEYEDCFAHVDEEEQEVERS